MNPQLPPQDFLLELLRDTSRRIDEVADKLDKKIDALDKKMSDDHRDLIQVVGKRLDDLDEIVGENKEKIAKHEHNFGVLTFLFTGFATVVSWFTWIGSLFGGKPHP